jgi:pimeloyl-ACP methyl ester carboxylesterase
VEFEATDGVTLSGLLFEPARRTGSAAIFLQGNGGDSVFDAPHLNGTVAEALARQKIAFFPFDNRGASFVRVLARRRGTTTDRIRRGMAFEKISECHFDIDGAARFLRSRGYRDLHLVGHSTGANKIALYNYKKPRNRFTSFVLLGGCDDCGLYRDRLGERGYRRLLVRCRAAIAVGKGDELVPEHISPHTVSWKALYDAINPEGDYNIFPFLEVMEQKRFSRKPLFREIRSIRRPTFAIYGGKDEFCFDAAARCAKILDAVTEGNVQTAIISGADHSFHGHETPLARKLAEWLGAHSKR